MTRMQRDEAREEAALRHDAPARKARLAMNLACARLVEYAPAKEQRRSVRLLLRKMEREELARYDGKNWHLTLAGFERAHEGEAAAVYRITHGMRIAEGTPRQAGTRAILEVNKE